MKKWLMWNGETIVLLSQEEDEPKTAISFFDLDRFIGFLPGDRLPIGSHTRRYLHRASEKYGMTILQTCHALVRNKSRVLPL